MLHLTLKTTMLFMALTSSSAYGDILHVPSQYPTIQAAIDAASSGDEIRIAPGFYSGFSFANSITLQGMGVEPSDVVIVSSSSSTDCSIDNILFVSRLYAYDQSTITNCDFTLSGLNLENPFGDTTIENCKFFNCSSTAAEVANGVATFINCLFINNTSSSSGGAMVLSDSIVRVENSSFVSNYAAVRGGAIATFSVNNMTIMDTLFDSNSSAQSGAADLSASGFGGGFDIIRCDFIGNSSTEGAGALRVTGPSSITNCMFQENVTNDSNGAAVTLADVNDNVPIISNSSFCANLPADLAGPFTDAGGNAFDIECDTCLADTNSDGILSPADFSAWIAAFNSASPECDQNGDGLCTPADFSAWIANFNAGCD